MEKEGARRRGKCDDPNGGAPSNPLSTFPPLFCNNSGNGKTRGLTVTTGGLSDSKVHLVPVWKATKRPWRNKPSGKFESKIRVATKPGEVISVDQLESPTPGLYGQLKGAATGKRYRAATIFVDHYSRFSFCYLQESLTSADTLKAKHAFEQFCGSHGVQVLHYHADNGRFADNAFIR